MTQSAVFNRAKVYLDSERREKPLISLEDRDKYERSPALIKVPPKNHAFVFYGLNFLSSPQHRLHLHQHHPNMWRLKKGEALC